MREKLKQVEKEIKALNFDTEYLVGKCGLFVIKLNRFKKIKSKLKKG